MNVTDDIKKFVDDYVFAGSEYLFFTKNESYCSRCRSTFEPIHLIHNELTRCPRCGADLTVKNTRYGRKSLINEACFYYFEKSVIDPKVIVCKGYYVTKDYSGDYKTPKFYYDLYAVYIFTENKSYMFKRYYWGDIWEERCSIFDFNQGWLANKICHCSFESIKEAVKNTKFQYMPYEEFEGHFSMVKLFDEYIKHPWIEQICKIGFENIVMAKLSNVYLHGCLNYKGKNAFKILRLSRKDVKEIRASKIDITPLYLKIYQLQAKENCRFTPKQVEDIERNYGYMFHTIKNIEKYTTFKKIIKYIDKQFIKYKSRKYSKSDIAIFWSDYIDSCLKLNMDIKNDSILYSKDVYTAHQNAIRDIKIKENEVFDKKISKRLKNLDKYCFEYNGLLIRPAKSSIELIDEGLILDHCVATYIERYAKGETSIMVIRKVSEPEKPYFTLELKNNAIIQCYGKHDCRPEKDITEFLEAFKSERLGIKEIKNKIEIPA